MLLLGMCLHSVGFHKEAAKIFAERIAPRRQSFSLDNGITTELVRSRVADATSCYWQASKHARDALRLVVEGKVSGEQRRALKTRGLYHLEQAKPQEIGPMIAFGDERVDWRPPVRDLVWNLISGAWMAFRPHWLVRHFRNLPGTYDTARSRHIRATHAANDHLMTMYGKIVSAVGTRLDAFNGRKIALATAEWLKTRGDRSGDFFTIACAEKYIVRLGGGSTSETERSLQLIRDPLNFALIRRDQAVEALTSGDIRTATARFEEAAIGARRCGSVATEIKALAGLAVCYRSDDSYLAEIARLGARVEGRGYVAYAKFLSPSAPKS